MSGNLADGLLQILESRLQFYPVERPVFQLCLKLAHLFFSFRDVRAPLSILACNVSGDVIVASRQWKNTR